jgi:hypothetical protein
MAESEANGQYRTQTRVSTEGDQGCCRAVVSRSRQVILVPPAMAFLGG